MAKSFFAPLMVSGVEDVAEGTVEIHVTSDLLKTTAGVVKWTVTDVDGESLLHGERNIRAAARTSRKVQTLNLAELTEQHEKRGLLIWLELETAGQVVSRNLVFFARPIPRPRIFSPRPKHLELSDAPGIVTKVTRKAGGRFAIALTSRRPAMWVWLELDGADAQLSDNFFHLRPGAAVTVEMAPAEKMTVKAVRERLMVKSLVDTYR